MQLVSASKMRRAQEYALRSRAYRDLAYDILSRLSLLTEVERQPMFADRPVKVHLIVAVTSNSGLAGAYNSNIIKLLAKTIRDDQTGKTQTQVIAIGNKAAQFARRLHGVELLAVYNSFDDQPSANDMRPILNEIIDRFRNGETDKVSLLYTQFKSNISQIARASRLLPASADEIPEAGRSSNTITNFEPSIEEVIDQITIRLIEAQLWQALLESLASEHSMRMLAMKNATDNANELIDDYTLEYNTARQAGITQELAEITGGAEALND